MSYIFSARFSHRITGGFFFLLIIAVVSAECRNAGKSDNKRIAASDGESVALGCSRQYAEYLKMAGDTITPRTEGEGTSPVAETVILVPRASVKLRAKD